jgi:hypothetical protein
MPQNPPEDPLISTKKHEKVVYISNLSEDVWPFIQAITSAQERVHEIEENANLADRELFGVADETDLVFITPKPFHPKFLEYYQELMGVKKLEVLSPATHTGLTSEDILQDQELFEKIVTIGKGATKLTLLSYSTSFQFLKLADELRKRGITVYTPEAPEEEDAWTVNFYGSKSGIRQLGQKSVAEEPDFMMADGLVCAGIIDAAKIAAKKYLKEDGVVIKTNKGHSGAGVLIFREGELPTEYHACEEAILEILKKDEYWDRFPIVIEDLINVNLAVGGGFPNVEFKIRKSGEIEVLYFCGLRVDENGVFHGVEMHEDVLNDRVEARVTDMGFFVGEEYARDGYRGYYDVDLVSAKNGDIYVSESNTRRTGGTHVFKTAQKLIGRDFMSDSYTLSDNNHALPNGIKPSFEQMLELLKPVLFDKKTQEGVVITAANLLQQSSLAYIVFGHSKKRSLEIENQMFALLQTL